jgi:uncharacterized protein YjbI with pentapeptide repeats
MSGLVSVITPEVLRLQEMYARGEEGGVRLVTAAGKVEIQANLSEANLRGSDLRRADLSVADLRGADLSEANLSWANLRGADLDFSCWPLWCGSKRVKVDAKITEQLAGHMAVIVVDLDGVDEGTAQLIRDWQEASRKLGKLGHRAEDLGLTGD